MQYDEVVVEAVAKIIHQNYTESPWEEADFGERIWALGTARAVLEKAHTLDEEIWANYDKSMEGDR